jgi:triacylglycerol lipase
MTIPQGPQPFNAALAVKYGELVNVAYSMIGNESNLTPTCTQLPKGYEFVAWVQMEDFAFSNGAWRFYGIIVHRTGTPNEYVLAIRGTVETDLREWVENLKSVNGIAVPNFGNVGSGFHQIFETMRVVKEGETQPTDIFGNALAGPKPFEEQVAEAVQSHAAKVTKAPAPPAQKISVEVTGHSLGSALATLYVAKNANAGLVQVPTLYTFASPLVGDATFVAAFSRLNIDSWRIANSKDVVTMVPVFDLDQLEPYKHVEQLWPIDPKDEVNKTITCLHLMDTYLHFVDPRHWLLHKDCAWVPNQDPGPNIGGITS